MSFQYWRNVFYGCRKVRRERMAAVPNVLDGQSRLALKRKKRRSVRKTALFVSKRASTSSSGRDRRLPKRFGPSKRRACAPDVENFRQIVGLNIEIHTYPQMKRGRAARRLVREGLATLAPINLANARN